MKGDEGFSDDEENVFRVTIDFILGELSDVRNSFSAFFESEGEFKFSTEYAEDKISFEELKLLGYHCFVTRLSFNADAIAVLLDSLAIERFMITELSVGILLRSCLLDCIYIFGWCEDENIIKELGYESFSKISKLLDLDEGTRSRFDKVGDFLNVDSLKRGRTISQILSLLGNERYAMNCYELYDWYSKYDHFSPIPFMYRRTFDERAGNIRAGLIFIKGALYSLHERFGTHSPNKNIFLEKLNVGSLRE